LLAILNLMELNLFQDLVPNIAYFVLKGDINLEPTNLHLWKVK